MPRLHRRRRSGCATLRRFARSLARPGQHAAYLGLLVAHFHPETIPERMRRHRVSVGHDGRLFDCDFHQPLALPLAGPERTIRDVADLGAREGREIRTAPHGFGCTAGAGSSRGGARTGAR